MREVQIRGDMIRLGQLLKLAGLIDSSGEAKAFLAERGALVNGEPEDRRGRQLHPGDEVRAGDELLRIVARYEDPRDEGRLADLVSAGMWTTAGLVGAAMFALPGSSHDHLLVGMTVAGAGVLWGVISLVLYLTRSTMSIGARAVVTVTSAPVVAAAIWASGGATSFLGPLLLFMSLFIGYFFPPRLAWPLVALFAGVFATPLLYDPVVVETAYPARAVAFAVAIAGESVVIQLLKRRLLRAEARQRVMAERDPLTALYNRRSFDAALERAIAQPDGVALVLFDFDDFKAHQRRARPPGRRRGAARRRGGLRGGRPRRRLPGSHRRRRVRPHRSWSTLERRGAHRRLAR